MWHGIRRSFNIGQFTKFWTPKRRSIFLSVLELDEGVKKQRQKHSNKNKENIIALEKNTL